MLGSYPKIIGRVIATLTMTKEKFEAYVKIQSSGVTNMWAVDSVCKYSHAYSPDRYLTKEDCLDIMKNYDRYEKEYGISVADFQDGNRDEDLDQDSLEDREEDLD